MTNSNPLQSPSEPVERDSPDMVVCFGDPSSVLQNVGGGHRPFAAVGLFLS